MKQYTITYLLLVIGLLCGCSDDILTNNSSQGDTYIMHSSIVNNNTRVALSQTDLNLLSQWETQDKIDVFAKSNVEKVTKITTVYVKDITPDRHNCQFIYTLPYSFEKNSDGRYQAYCFTENCYPVIVDKKMCCNASLIRSSLSKFHAPVYSNSLITKEEDYAAFQHYYTYEVLHIKNNSNQSTQFSLSNPEASLTWYRSTSLLCVEDNTYTVDMANAKPQQDVSDEITIPAGVEDVFISAYIPNGLKIQDMRLVMKINGEYKKTTNTFSSDVELQTGHAYHMYATWDGTELKFGKDSDIEVPEGFVDLGLPSKTLWATCNLGADKQEDYGNYVAWGELRGYDEGKTYFSWSNYAFCKGTSNSLTKYCTKSVYGANGFTDNLVELTVDDDCVSSTLGFPYAIPTKAEWDELIRECTWTKSGNGVIVKSKRNGNVIFFPCAGYRSGVNLYDNGSEGYYWTSSLDVNSPDDAWFVYIGNGKAQDNDYYRCMGRSIRPIMRNGSRSSTAKSMAPATNQNAQPTAKTVEGGMVVKTMSRAAH